jgi:DNA-binding CsgD family transcriptional regulator/tetratricopeptide (TPR) repeat protein
MVIDTPDEGVRRGVFVGRQAELEILSGALAAARASEPQIVWIEGEPGIGKTAFLRRFLANLEGATVLQASGEESETTLEYGVALQLLAQVAPGSTWTAVEEQIGKRAPASSFAVGADLLTALGAVQGDEPAVIAIDDAHWIDQSSAGALLFALRRLHGDRVLVLIASRPDGLNHLGPSWSRLLNDSDRVRRITLAGLDAPQVGQLADSLGIGTLTAVAGERLAQHTSGHPLYVKALLTELSLDRLNQPDGELPAPHSFAATVLARLTKLTIDAQDLVAAAAVAGERCQLSFAASVAGIDDPLPAVEKALDAELLSLVAGRIPQEIEFPHPLVRAAVYEDLSVSRRRALHLACARLSSEPASLGHRVAASDGADDGLAAELRKSAEADISEFHLTVGIERLLWASRVAASDAVRERALLRAVECQVLAGDIPGANSRLDAVMACSDSARRTFTIGLLTAAAGRVPDAQAAFREVISRPDYRRDPELAGPVTSSLALVCALQGYGEDAVHWARRALDLPESSPTAEMTARSALGFGLLMTGRGDEAIETLASLSASTIEPEPLEAELLASRGSFKAWWGDLAGAQEDLSAVVRWSRAGVPVRSLPNAYGGLAEVEFHLGRWDDGLAHADVAISVSEDTDRAWDRSYVHAVASYLTAARGNWDAASGHVEAARRAAEAAPLPRSIYYACAAAAHLAWVHGEWDTVLRELRPIQALLDGGARAVGLGQRAVQAIAAEALMMTERLEQSEALVAMIEDTLDESLPDFTRVEVWRLRGLIEQARERPDHARRAFERGKNVAGCLEAPLAEGLLELAYGRFLRRSGSRRAAIAMLRWAGDRFRALEASPWQSRCEGELTACGVRSPDRGDDNRYGLTAREDIVARLVASGKSNREVAEELFLSTKAIEYHLGNVFAKVDIRSRHELASRLSAGAR